MFDMSKKPFYLNEKKQKWVKDKLDSMTVKEKAGQLFCLPIFGSIDDAISKYNELPFGAVMFRPNEGYLIRECSLKMRKELKIPPLVAANLESGGSGIAFDGTLYGPQMQVAATNSYENGYILGSICAKEAKALGVNWSFAPVVDIDYNWRNPITNVRTYGSDANKVLEYARRYQKACLENGIAVSLKHFPGDGVDERDQHIVASVNLLTTEQWDETYGKIYKTLIDEGAQTVMAGHIMQPAYCKLINPDIRNRDIMPATLSYELITMLLRGKLGFNGLVVTDAANMVGMCGQMQRKKLVPASINAGCDVFLFGKNAKEDYQYMLDAIENGELSKERLDEAVSRILALKAHVGLDEEEELPDISIVGCKEHQKLARKCADQSITLVKDTQNLLPVTPEKYKKVWLHILDEPGFTDSTTCEEVVIDELIKAGFEVIYDDKEEKKLSDTQIPINKLKEKCDIIMYFANIVNASYKTTTRLKWSSPAAIDAPYYTEDIPTMFISLSNPYHFVDVPNIKTIINSYSPSRIVVQETIKKIKGESKFKGVSPVDAFAGMWGKDI